MAIKLVLLHAYILYSGLCGFNCFQFGARRKERKCTDYKGSVCENGTPRRNNFGRLEKL